jgi:hypothetical protein
MANQLQITGDTKVKSLNGVLTGTSGIVGSVPLGAANGVATLDSGGKVPVSQLPSSVVTYLGTWNAATNTPTLTNGVGDAGDMYICNVAGTVNFGAGPVVFAVGDWVLYGSGTWQKSSGQNGTVTSVGATITGGAIGITGSPITTAGTLAFAFAGTSGQYVNGAGNLTTFPTLITSIGLSMPSAFSVANSPLTANGSINVTGAGNASQYIRGDGTLAAYNPSTGGGGSSVSYYLNGGTNQGTFVGNTYYEMSKTAVIGTGVDFTINANGYISQFITDANDPAQLVIPAGNWNFEMYFSASSSGGSPSFYVELYKYNGSTFTLIADNSANPEYITNGTAVDLYTTSVAVPETSLTITDRLAIRVYVTHASKTITLHTQNSHLCEVITTFSTGITALNGLTAQVQYFAVGTSGSDFNISSVTDTHTFNLPTASATNRGALSSADWSTFNNKQSALTFSSPLVNTSGTVSIPAATSSVNGYLSSTDWSVFNGKQAALSGTGIVKSTAGTISYLTDNSTNWNTAYNRSLTSAAVTGTTTKTLTLNQQDGGTITASWTDINTDAVTSVFGRTGAIIAVSGDYNTDLVTEGTTNLYFTNSRARLALSAGTGISYNNTTGVITSTITQYTDALARAAISLTTTGTSGAATYNSTTGVLNIPQYIGGVTSVFGRTGAVVATEGDYSLTQLSDVTITSPTTNQVLKYNGTTWINDTDANTGTVTSVGLSAPTGFSVSGSPVTSSGTLALAFASGYSLPTNVKQSNWDDAYTWVAAFPTQTGNNGKYLTTNGSALSWADNPLGTVTSVAMTVPTGLSVSGSPITSSGTLGVTFAAGYSIPTNASQTNWDTAYTNRITSLTTTGASGSATLVSNVLNVPTYTLAGLGGISLTSLSATLPLSYNNTTGAFSIQVANTSQSGYLSSTDWNTFNNKQSALTNPVTGTGTTNYLPKFTGASTIGNSIVQDNGSTISISTNSTVLSLDRTGAGTALIELKTNGTVRSYFGADASVPFIFFNQSASPLMQLNASGNLGLGVTPSAWGGGWKVLEFSNGNSFGSAGVQAGITQNAYNNGSNWIYNTNGASAFYQANSGSHIWYTAPSGTAGNDITFTQAMTLVANGNLLLGITTDQGYKLFVNGQTRIDGFSGNPALQIRDSGSTFALMGILGSQTGDVNWLLMSGYPVAGDFTIRQSDTVNALTLKKTTGAATFSSSVAVGAGMTIGTSGTNDISWNTAGGIKLSRTNVGPEYALSQRWTGSLAYIDIGSSTQWNGGVTILPNGGGNVLIGTTTDAGYKLDVNGTGRFSDALSGTSATFSGTSGAFIGVTINNTDSTGSSRLRVTSTGSNVTDVISYSASHASRANQSWLGGDGSSTTTVLQAGGVEFLRGASTGAATFSSGIATLGYTASTSYAGLFGGTVGVNTSTPTGILEVGGNVGITWPSGSGNPNAVLVIGTKGYQGSAWFNTPAGNPSYPCGLGIYGSYSEPTATINITAYAPNASGGYASNLVFSNTLNGSVVERMRITSGGVVSCLSRVLVNGATDDSVNALQVNGSIVATSTIASVVASNVDMFVFNNTGATYTKSCVVASMTATGGTGSYFFYGQQSTSTVALKIFSNGNIQNTNNSYGAISDARLKENIIDATPKLADLMKVKVRNYNLKGESNKQLGVISQELEEIFPNMIEESTNLGENVKIKGVKYSIFVPMLIKAVQEQQEQINELKQLLNK